MKQNSYDSFGRMYVIPMFEENKQFLCEVDRSTKELVRRRFSIFYEYDWECNTVATVCLKTLCSVLYMSVTGAMSDILNIVDEDDEHVKYIDFCGLLKIHPSMRHNEKAEKMGSINCKFTLGKKVSDIVFDDNSRYDEIKKEKVEEYYLTGDDRIDEAWEKLDKLVRTELADKYKIISKHHFSAIAVTECFLETLYRKMITLLNLDRDTHSVSTNVNDYFEMTAFSVPNPDGSIGVKFTLNPGKYSKITIKSDITTEKED